MKPVLFSIDVGGRQLGLHTYGLLIAVGFAIGIALAYREARRLGLDGGKVLDLAFWILVLGLLGSRLLYVLLNAGEIWRVCRGDGDAARTVGRVISDCAEPLKVWEGGLIFYGGVAAAVVAIVRLSRRNGWRFAATADIFAPALAIGHAFGRLGCFAAGCCFGKACLGGWGASFPPGSVAFDELRRQGAVGRATLTPALHPTQLYEAAGELVLFGVLVALRGRKRFHGQLALVYALGYGLLRFVVEMFRGDVARRFIVEFETRGLAAALGLPPAEPVFLSVSQLVSLGAIGGAAALLARRHGRAIMPP